MPTTVNGIGTHYYGKQNLEKRTATCAHCGRVEDLQTYDTRLWFVVIFIPIIPLGKKRILDECPSCRMHAQVGAKQWEEMRGKAIREAKAEYEATPDSSEKAIGLHVTLASGGERQAADQFTEMMLKRFHDNSDVQVYLGGYFEESNQMERSNQCFHRAYEIDPDDNTNRQVSAVALLREGRTSDAQARIKEAVVTGEAVDPALTFSIANALHAANDPAGAAELLDVIGKQAPAIRKEKAFRQLAKQVEKATGAEEGVLAPKQSLFENKGFWWSVAAAAVVVGLVAWDLYLTNNQPLYVVNGLPVAITVEIDGGAPVTVNNGRPAIVRLGGGTHTAKVTAPAELAGESAFEIESARTARWFSSPAHILDPTHSAVVAWEETIFSDVPVDDEVGFEMAVGRLQSSFDNADYHFEEFPNELQVDDTTKQVTKSRVYQVDDVTPIMLAINDPNWTDDPATLDYLEPHLIFGEKNEQLLGLYVRAAEEHGEIDRCFAFFESRLDATPVDVDWHRAFHSVAEVRKQDVRPQYDELLKQSPRDANLMYLRGRLETQASASGPYFERARRADPANARVLAAITYSKAAGGDFDAALETINKALAIDEDVPGADELRDGLMIALDRQLELEDKLNDHIIEPPFNFGATQRMISSLASRGRNRQAKQTHEEFVERLQAAWPDDPHELQKRSAMHLYLTVNDQAAAARTAETFANEEHRTAYQLLSALDGGDTSRAAERTNALPEDDRGPSWMWVSLLSQSQGDDAAAKKYRRLAAATLSKYGGDNAAIAELIADGLPRDELVEKALGLDIEPTQKAAVLLLVAPRVGDDAKQLVQLADRLNRFPSNYQSLIQAAIAKLSN